MSEQETASQSSKEHRTEARRRKVENDFFTSAAHADAWFRAVDAVLKKHFPHEFQVVNPDDKPGDDS